MSAFTPSGSIVFDSVVAESTNGIEFDDWYNNEHLNDLCRFFPDLVVRRYVSAPRASMTSIFELIDKSVTLNLESSLGSFIQSHERFIAHPISSSHRPHAENWIEARIAYPVFFAVPDAEVIDFNNWYEQEHLDILFRCESWLACRRFQITNNHPKGWTHLALHYLSDVSALRSPERTLARSTSWRERLALRPWFKGDYRILHKLV